MTSKKSPLACLYTEIGDLVIAADIERAPISAGDFLHYVDRGLYRDAAFYRTVRLDNDHGDPNIEIIQGGLLDWSMALPPVAHESTATTGIRHVHGVVSLARGVVGTGSASAFFICIGDQAALDFGGTRNGDRLGFAAFGKVIGGLHLLRKIHDAPVRAESESDYTRGQLIAVPIRIIHAERL